MRKKVLLDFYICILKWRGGSYVSVSSITGTYFTTLMDHFFKKKISLLYFLPLYFVKIYSFSYHILADRALFQSCCRRNGIGKLVNYFNIWILASLFVCLFKSDTRNWTETYWPQSLWMRFVVECEKEDKQDKEL